MESYPTSGIQRCDIPDAAQNGPPRDLQMLSGTPRNLRKAWFPRPSRDSRGVPGLVPSLQSIQQLGTSVSRNGRSCKTNFGFQRQPERADHCSCKRLHEESLFIGQHSENSEAASGRLGRQDRSRTETQNVVSFGSHAVHLV